jgi:endonuclease/exonuclease/phosphatase family metal-dependent hydrolase
VRVLTWNLFHGRSDPPAGRDLLPDFAERLATWAWDVALLQEVLPWWPPELAAAAGAQYRTALTSRNALLPLRRALATRYPDVVKSNGGGSNAILVRGMRITEHRVARLRFWPERRVVHAVHAAGVWIANLHAQVHSERRAQADLAAAARHLIQWSGDGPAVLGGDTNTRRPQVPGFTVAAGHDVDFVLVRHLRPAAPAEVLDRGRLSDHAPIVAVVE